MRGCISENAFDALFRRASLPIRPRRGWRSLGIRTWHDSLKFAIVSSTFVPSICILGFPIKSLKTIYRAEDAVAAHAALQEFEDGPWGKRFAAITQAWCRNWVHVIPVFAYPPRGAQNNLHHHTTNAIESLNSQLRRSVRMRGHFPNDEAATKLIWLQLREITKDWKMPPREWAGAKAQFAVMFGDRFIDSRSIVNQPAQHINF